jgi:hypothetical protein
MQAGIPKTQVEKFPTAGHFVMLEEPQSFSEKLKIFLDKEDVSNAVSQPQGAFSDPKPSVTLAP